MSESSLHSIEGLESSQTKSPEPQARLHGDPRDVSMNEQRQLLNDEHRRISSTTQHFLPNVLLTDGAKDLPEKDPKVAADADKRKRELAMRLQNQTTPAGDHTTPADNTNRNRTAGVENNPQSRPRDGGSQGPQTRDGGSRTSDGRNVSGPSVMCPVTTADSNLRSPNLRGLFERNVLRLDTDRDGFVSSSEIDSAVMDPTYTGQDAQLVTVLHQHREELEELSNDELGDEDDGVTLNDIRQFDSQLFERNISGHMHYVGSVSFDGIDADRDGHLSALELDRAALAPGVTDDYRQTVQQMRTRIEEMEEASNDELGDEDDGITRADLAAYQNQIWDDSPNALFGGVDSTFYHAGESMRQGCRNLYATPNPLDSIRPDAINQGAIGDCYFLAAMGSMASDPLGRQQIQNMIRDNGNGTYTVTFPGAPDEPITVTAPSDSEMAIYARGNPMGTWPAILERAYGTYCQQHPERRSPLNPDGGTNPAEGADGGSWTHDGIRMLTGRGVDVDINQLNSEDELALNLQQALAEHRPVTCCTSVEATDDLGLTDAQGLPAEHEYSVLAFDPTTRLVTVRNPWGHAEPEGPNGGARDGHDDGVFVMTLAEYRRAFLQTAYAERA